MTSRNIAICSDGTGKTAFNGRGTNVFKLYEAVAVGDYRQIAIYDDGVGTQSLRLFKVIGGARPVAQCPSAPYGDLSVVPPW